MPASAPGWHDSADCSQRAHNVGVELAVHQLVVDEFKGALYFETCVVDEDVDRPGIGQGVVDRLGTTHIEVTHLDVEALGCREQVVALGKVAHLRTGAALRDSLLFGTACQHIWRAQNDIDEGMTMTDTDTSADTEIQWLPAGFRSPEQEQAEKGADVAPADELAIEDINPLNAHLYADDRYHRYFERLRNEDPIHFNEIETAGRYWSVTKGDDIKAVEGDWQTFSSASGITLGVPTEERGAVGAQTSAFIAMDPPEHRAQRRTVTPAVQPKNLMNLESLIRERTVEVLESLPVGETFDWVETVSIELTTRMLATLFDFPFEDRKKLARWSDIVFAIPEPGGVIESHEQRQEELMECVQYFSGLWEERRETRVMISSRCSCTARRRRTCLLQSTWAICFCSSSEATTPLGTR